MRTFGVEIEMNHLSRKDAAAIAAEYFGTRCQDTADVNHYSCWSAWDQKGREWKFMSDSSIEGSDTCEMVTPILTVEDMTLLQDLCRKIRRAGARSDADRKCGVHIHIGAGDMTAKALGNLAIDMANHEEILSKAVGISNSRRDYCKKTSEKFLRNLCDEHPNSLADLKNIWYANNGGFYGISQHYHSSRYHMLNLHAFFTKGTVEFRLFEFDKPTFENRNGINAKMLKAWIYLCLGMVERAVASEEWFANDAKAVSASNMHEWLSELGVTEDAAHDYLTRKLISRKVA